MNNPIDDAIATAIIGIDTLWGGDVQCPSGTGRFIADSWFSGEPLPRAYTDPTADSVRQSGGVSAKTPDPRAIDTYLTAVDVPAAISSVAAHAKDNPGYRGAYLGGLAECFQIMWELAQEILGQGPAVPYERCVQAGIGAPPSPSEPAEKREMVAQLLGRAGYTVGSSEALLDAVDTWRRDRLVPTQNIADQGAEFIKHYDELTQKNVLPHLPSYLQDVPRANVKFLPIENAWFSGSMNYLGRARDNNGTPQYEATYELNAALEISVPEFQQLVSHEVVPGHVTTFAYLQNAYHRKQVGFESTVLTMNTRAAALFEGIANNAILMALDCLEVSEIADTDLRIGVLLALLQDDAKNQSSYLTWGEGWRQTAVAEVLRRDFLCSAERADKLSGAWGRHPLLGRMYLPAYRAGTDRVAELRRRYPPEIVLPAMYGCSGLVDLVTLPEMLAEASSA